VKAGNFVVVVWEGVHGGGTEIPVVLQRTGWDMQVVVVRAEQRQDQV
jgi:hypothetical protein